MDGHISVSSTEGSGSVFKVVFSKISISDTFIHEIEYHNDPQNVVFEKADILVVDDVISNIETIENLLASSGLTILSTTSGTMALEMIRQSPPSLILLDIRMPDMDGFEVAKHLKANVDTMNIPIIAFTASVMSSGKIDHYSAFDGVLYKPVKRAELFSMLIKFLNYSAEEIPENEGSPGADEPEPLSPEVFANLPLIIELLEKKFMPKWEGIKDTFILFNIEDFADELMNLATEYHLTYLTRYSARIKESVDMVELESIRMTLSEFPVIIKRLSSLKA
jgi:CheY-like chemotaxis protein